MKFRLFGKRRNKEHTVPEEESAGREREYEDADGAHRGTERCIRLSVYPSRKAHLDSPKWLYTVIIRRIIASQIHDGSRVQNGFEVEQIGRASCRERV